MEFKLNMKNWKRMNLAKNGCEWTLRNQKWDR